MNVVECAVVAADIRYNRCESVEPVGKEPGPSARAGRCRACQRIVRGRM